MRPPTLMTHYSGAFQPPQAPGNSYTYEFRLDFLKDDFRDGMPDRHESAASQAGARMASVTAFPPRDPFRPRRLGPGSETP
jgi:hypothetical protein